MTADSGEIWCAWRRTSTPSTPGILMSVTMTSNRALSILRFARSPPVTVSTLWPSRRRAISSSSQMERSSSQTRILPTPSSFSGCEGSSRGLCRNGAAGAYRVVRLLHTAQTQHKAGALAKLGARPNLALVRLHDLVDDGEAEAGSTFKVRLEGLKDFFRLLRVNAGTGVGKTDLPVRTPLGEGYSQRSTLIRSLDRPHRVFREVPEHLFEFVAIGEHPGFGVDKRAREFDAGILGGKPVLQQSESVLEQRNQIHTLEAIVLASGIGEKIADDVVEALGFADDNLQKVALVGIQRGSVRQHGYRTGNGSQGITNFVGDGGSQTAHGSETILHADLAFEAADLGEIVKGINKAKIAAGTDIERRDANAKSLAEAI